MVVPMEEHEDQIQNAHCAIGVRQYSILTLTRTVKYIKIWSLLETALLAPDRLSF